MLTRKTYYLALLLWRLRLGEGSFWDIEVVHRPSPVILSRILRFCRHCTGHDGGFV